MDISNDEIKEEDNWKNSYTKRLLQLRKNNIQNMHNSNVRTSFQHTERQYFEEKREYSFLNNLKRLTPSIRYLKESLYTAKQTFVPMFLIMILIIFFAFIIVMYVNISPDIENSLQQSISYASCNDQDSHTFECINPNESNMEALRNILKIISLELQNRATKNECNQKSAENVMWCLKDVLDFMTKQNENHENYSEILKRLHDVQYLIEKNTFLGLINVDTLGNSIDLRLHKAEGRSFNNEYCFALLSPREPLYCSIYTKIHKYFAIIGSLSAIAIIVFLLHKLYLFLVDIREKRKRQINQIIDDIIAYVLESTKDEKGKCIIVNEMKDKLFLRNKNIELTWAWNKAVKYLENNDNRIHFGYENNENGEDVKIIRRISIENDLDAEQKEINKLPQNQNSFLVNNKNQPLEESSKKWNGPAFDKSNKIKDPPTNCLKIRQMFDKFEINNPNLLAIIQDIILLKVADKKCKIYDIQLDKKTCCVYVKCKSCVDAGIIHDQINGWWLDQKLIVVKFLREDKFNQRFQSSYC